MKSFKRKLLSFALCAILTFNMTTEGYASGIGGMRAAVGASPKASMGFFDGLDAFGNATATIGCILNVGSVLANADWSDPGAVCLGLVDTIFGTGFGGDPVQESLDAIYSDVEEIKGTTNQINDSVNYLKANSIYVNKQLSVINGSLNTVNSRLAIQSQQLSEISSSLKQMNSQMKSSFDKLNNLIEDSTDTITSAVYSSTTEIKKTDKLNDALNTYVSDYSKLYTYDNNILETLSAMQDSYTAFYDEIVKLDNGTEVLESLNKVTLEEDNFEKLNKTDQDILTNTYVTVGGKKQQVYKFHKDFVKTLMEFVAGTGKDSSQSVYTLNNNVGNIGDTVLAMGDYLTAENQTFNELNGGMGIGEMYYLYCTMDNLDSETVHSTYRSFMDSMVAQYMTTAWLAEMAYGYRIVDEANGDNNATTIRNYEQYINRIHAQMVKVTAYYDCEYKKCITKYDFGGSLKGHDQDMTFYANSLSEGVWSVKNKKDVMVPNGISASEINIALGEQYDLYYFYRHADVSRRDGVVWTSSNPQVAAVDNYGEVLGLSRGVAVITAEYMGTTASCTVAIGDVMAVPNEEGINRYHYYSYYSKGGNWVTDDTLYFETESNRGYDFYYGVNTFVADTVELSEETRSASIIESTGMTDANMQQFTWFATGDGAVQMNGYEISAVSSGWTEVIGYKKDESAHTYDFIGVPIHSSMNTLFVDNAKDYSEYEEISSAEDLIDLANSPEKWGSDSKYVLTADIDLGGMEWEPIGYSIGFGSHLSLIDYNIGQRCTSKNGVNTYSVFGVTKPFCGIFDGNGHTISNYKITKIPRTDEFLENYNEIFADESNVMSESYKKLSVSNVGLFGYACNADIVDLNVTDAVIDIDTANGTGIKIDGSEVEFADGFSLYAGLLTGINYYEPLRTVLDDLANKLEEIQSDGEISEEDIEIIENYLDVPARFAEYYNYYKEEEAALIKAGEEVKETAQEKYLRMLMGYAMSTGCKAFRSREFDGCYVTGDINVINATEKGKVNAGLISGAYNNSIDKCSTIGNITVNAKNGGAGGLVGKWSSNSGTKLTNNKAEVCVNALGGLSSGGIVGIIEGQMLFDDSIGEYQESDDVEMAETRSGAYLVIYILSSLFGIGDIKTVDKINPNAIISDNEVIGDIIGEGYTGGIAGYKTSVATDADQCNIVSFDMQKNASGEMDANITYTNYNVDIVRNYVAADITADGGAVAGILGYANLKEGGLTVSDSGQKTLKEGYSTVKGKIEKNYYTGKIDAGSSGYAAGLVGMVESDYAYLTQNISAATKIIGGGKNKVAYLINGRENGMPLVKGTDEDWNVDGGIAYNGMTEWVGDDLCTKGNADTFNDPQTYIEIFGDDNFLELSGGLKEDGSVGLDLENGLIPKKLDNRVRFETEVVPKTYHQGDEFVPVTGIYIYTGTGTEYITEGVKSTVPDMTEIGIHRVELTYGDFKDSYDIYIYPNAGYLNITEETNVAKDGTGILGGKVTLYENGNVNGTEISIDNCEVTVKDGGIFVIRNGKYTTALRAVMVDVYTNSTDSALAQYVGREYYGQGKNADVSELVPTTKTVDGKTYRYRGASDELKFKAINDVCILTYYSTDDVNDNGNSNENENTDNPSDEKVVNGPKAGTKISDKKYTYKVTKAGSSDAEGTVKVTGLKKKSLRQVKIAAKVTINKVTYKITAVDKNAFRNNKKITKATIGKNVKTIGNNAFAGCIKLKQVTVNAKGLKSLGKNVFKGDKKLNKIILKSTKLKKVGKNAIKKTSKRLVIKVPKTKKKVYTKKFKKAGNKKVKVK